MLPMLKRDIIYCFFILEAAIFSTVASFSLKGSKPGCFSPHTREQESVGTILPCGNKFDGFRTYTGDWCECRGDHEWVKVVGTDALHSNHMIPTDSSYLASCFRRSTLSFVPSGALVPCAGSPNSPMCTCSSTKFLDVRSLDITPAPSIDPNMSFRMTDTDGDGRHCINEIVAQMMSDFGWVKHPKLGIYVDSAVLEGFVHADLDKDGTVTLGEFLKALPDQTAEDFNAADLDRDGKHVLSEQISSGAAEKIAKDLARAKLDASEYIVKADTDGDQCISHSEFTKLL